MKNVKYIFWKVIIHLLVAVMTMFFGVLLCIILSASALDAHIISLAGSGATMLVYILLQYWLIERSDLSGISMTRYLLGETAAFSVLTILSNGILAIISGGLPPIATSYGSLPFFALSHLFKNILLGSAAIILLYFLAVLLLYTVKKKKDPTLKGRNKTVSVDTNEVTSDD